VAAVLLGLCIAAAFGSGDFVGGRASTSASTIAVLAVAQACSVVGAFAVALLVTADVAASDLVFGAAAGVLSSAGLGLLYHALAQHAAGVVAPITAVVGATVPVVWGFANGERPSTLVVAGIVVAIAAGALVAREPGNDAVRETPRAAAGGSAQAALAGILFGTSFVLFAETSQASGQWPVLAARVAALFFIALALAWLMRAHRVTFPRGRARLLAGSRTALGSAPRSAANNAR